MNLLIQLLTGFFINSYNTSSYNFKTTIATSNMQGKLFTDIQIKLILEGQKNSFWEIGKNNTSPKHSPGKIMYLKEPYIEYTINGTRKVFYKYFSEQPEEIHNSIIKWKNKLFMPERLARHYIKITACQSTSFHEINCTECIDRGLPVSKCHKNKINPDANSIVWKYQFEVIP